MTFHIWRLHGDKMTIVHGEWSGAAKAASDLTEQTGVYHVAVEQGSEYEQQLQAEKVRKEQSSPVIAKPDSILSMIEDLEEQWQRGEITFEECSQQQQGWCHILAQIDGR
jgi:hypothetical protein